VQFEAPLPAECRSFIAQLNELRELRSGSNPETTPHG
jgi:23S rRNA pseudouridine955/2504/2580 synthase